MGGEDLPVEERRCTEDHSRGKNSTLVPLWSMLEGRGHVRGSKVLDEEVRRSIGDCSRRKSLALMPLSELFDARVYVGESKGSSLGGARDYVRSY